MHGTKCHATPAKLFVLADRFVKALELNVKERQVVAGRSEIGISLDRLTVYVDGLADGIVEIRVIIGLDIVPLAHGQFIGVLYCMFSKGLSQFDVTEVVVCGGQLRECESE